LEDCSEFGNFVITLIYYIYILKSAKNVSAHKDNEI
jgi:hypothetical protein